MSSADGQRTPMRHLFLMRHAKSSIAPALGKEVAVRIERDLYGGSEHQLLDRKYPTGALATLEFNGSWRELRSGSAELTDFVTPKDLARH
jgi:phosphohistidine phosphatase SixA